MNFIQGIGVRVIAQIEEMGAMLLFLLRSFGWLLRPPLRFFQIVKQMHFVGFKSVFVVILTALFTGMVLALQGYYSLRKFGSEGLLGSAVALSMIRELGPVLASLMVTARAGSAMTAEIGIMRITEQIDALETMAINSLQYLITPKMVASLISVPFLVAIFDVVGIGGGYVVGVKLLGVSGGSYWSSIESAVEWKDVYGGMLKSVSFGLIVSWVCCYKGYYTKMSAEGLGKATTESVVLASVLILVWDYFLTSILL
ncbi:MAG: ABC transporter permease [Nitrospirota bacterium]|nr:ABC transporter permease [Nitrospirota bacterium]